MPYVKNLIKKIVRAVQEKNVRSDLPPSMNYVHSDVGAVISALVHEMSDLNNRISKLEALAHRHDCIVRPNVSKVKTDG